MGIKHNKGQSTLEYAIILAVVVALVIAVIGSQSSGPLNQTYNTAAAKLANAAALMNNS